MTRLVFVHGMRQEGQDPRALEAHWTETLVGAWKKAGLSVGPHEIRMPFYGDRLDELSRTLSIGDATVVQRAGEAGPDLPEMQAAILRRLAARAGISDSEILDEASKGVVDRGVANWEVSQACARLLGRKVPWLERQALKLVTQVDAYLTRPHVREAVDALVGPAVNDQASVVVAHSLGTIVSYTLLQKLRTAKSIRLFVTLGSPLGIGVVKRHIEPPSPGIPASVAAWLNASDERDYVALYSRLDRDTFCSGIQNLCDLHNDKDDPHAIASYLRDETVAGRIAEALNG